MDHAFDLLDLDYEAGQDTATTGGPAEEFPSHYEAFSWYRSLPLLLLPPLYAARSYRHKAFDNVWPLLPFFSTFILTILTLLVAYYTQATNPTVCAMPPHLNSDYVHLLCGNYAYKYYSAVRGVYHHDVLYRHGERQEGDSDTRVHLVIYSYFPLVFALVATICYLPQLLWNALQVCDPKGLNLKETVTALRGDDHATVERCFKELRGKSTVTKLMMCKVFSFSVAAGLAALCFYVTQLTTLPIFAKEVLCELRTQGINTYHTSTLSCVMPQNFYNEQIVILLTFWFGFVAVANVGSIIAWLFLISHSFFSLLSAEIGGILPASMLYTKLSYTQILSVCLVWDIYGYNLCAKYIAAISKCYCDDHNIHLGPMNGAHEDRAVPINDDEGHEAEDQM